MFINFVKQAKTLLHSTKYCAGRNKAKPSPYDILGITKDADQSTIKKAYYKMAQQYHPDKNSSPNAKEKFAQINNAYEILSDDSKKKMYDQTGSTQNPFGEGMDFEDIFSHFGAGGFPGGFKGANQGNFDQSIFQEFAGMFMGGGKNQKPSAPRDVVVNLDIQFRDSVFGAQKEVKYFHRVVCVTCHGNKAKPGTKPKKCNSCHGKGSIDYRQGGMIFKMPCGTCEGQGTLIRDFCTKCKGQGIEQKQSVQKITIPKGAASGSTIRMAGKGSCNQDLHYGDLLVKVSVKSNSKFKRQGNDVSSTVFIPLADAVLGTEVKVETIYGQSKVIKIPEGSQSGDKIRLAGEGFQKGTGFDKGAHFVVISIQIPKRLTSRQRQLFEQLRCIHSSQ